MTEDQWQRQHNHDLDRAYLDGKLGRAPSPQGPGAFERFLDELYPGSPPRQQTSRQKAWVARRGKVYSDRKVMYCGRCGGTGEQQGIVRRSSFKTCGHCDGSGYITKKGKAVKLRDGYMIDSSGRAIRS